MWQYENDYEDMDTDDLISALSSELEDLGFDYDRMSESGKQTYDKVMSIMAKLTQ